MTTTTMGGFPARPDADRNAFLVLIAFVWIGVLTGFGTVSFRHITTQGFDYPLIVHVHAVVFVSWLSLFTAQIGLIRGGRRDLHRRLGIVGAALAAIMLVVGPVTAFTVTSTRYFTNGETPEFLAVQLTDMIGFAVLTAAGLILRHQPAAHKRLMFLGLLCISNAGFARFLAGFAAAPFGDGPVGGIVRLFIGSTALLVCLGVYDLVTRGRLHRAYVAGAVFIVLIQVLAVVGLDSPAWKAFTLKLIGA